VVFTNGVFDLLHPGHVELLEAARREGSGLVVGVNSDASVRQLAKGRERPVAGEAARARVLAGLASVDCVVLFDEDTPLALIEALEPDVLVKGADYTRDRIVGADLVEARGGRVVRVPLLAGFSTSALVERLRAPT
jgi:rfaE bifunctional protein nucleotidyltransferase chain/domain